MLSIICLQYIEVHEISGNQYCNNLYTICSRSISALQFSSVIYVQTYLCRPVLVPLARWCCLQPPDPHSSFVSCWPRGSRFAVAPPRLDRELSPSLLLTTTLILVLQRYHDHLHVLFHCIIHDRLFIDLRHPTFNHNNRMRYRAIAAPRPIIRC